jgi:hypothetical protein
MNGITSGTLATNLPVGRDGTVQGGFDEVAADASCNSNAPVVPRTRVLARPRPNHSGSMKNAFAATSIVWCLAGCTGQIFGDNASGGDLPGASNGSGGSGSTGVGGNGVVGSAGGGTPLDPNAAGPMPLRRLSHIEYNNTVADLLGDTSEPADDFPADEAGGVSPFPVAGAADSLVVSRLAEAAEALAKAADLSKILPCQAGNDEAGCAGRFIDEFGAKAFRRPLLAAEKARLLAVYQSARSNEALDFNGGIRSLIEAMLQSAPFLYHWELGPQPAQLEGGAVRLNAYELASRLSYFLWGSMPDAELFTAAVEGKLSTDAELNDQAHRMLTSPRANVSLKTFFSQWFGLDQMHDRTKDADTYPEFTDDLKTAMTSELEALSAGVMLDGDGHMETLLTSTQAQLSAPSPKSMV